MLHSSHLNTDESDINDLSSLTLARLFTLRAMAAERLNSIRSQMIPAYGLAAIETWSSAFKLLGTCPALLNERVVCNGCTAAISDMLGSFTIDWTAACCLYCINLEQPNGLKRTLPDAILAQLRSLADSDATHGAVRLLAAWALTSSLQFAGLDPRLSRLGILMTTTSSPFMRDRVLYSR